jgi:uncharacterized membrane protein (UPF0127 family)
MTACLRALSALLLLPTLIACAHAAAPAPTQLRDFPQTTLTLTHPGGRDTFHVWVADTPSRQMQGLMFVRSMPADHGMLFPQSPPRVMSMWMKNTFLPLDMVFIGTDGTVTGVAANTVPQSLQTITSPGPVSAVLELNAGEAARRGIGVGSRLELAGP